MKCCLVSVDDSSSSQLFKELCNRSKDVHWHWTKDKALEVENFDRVFVFRWPHIIPQNILTKKDLIGFHTSNLPDGRGGSPLQNQIMDGITITRVNAIKLVEDLDAGPIYDSAQISLQGPISDVWSVIASVAADLIIKIIENNLIPMPQSSYSNKVYKRRRNNSIDQVEDIQKLHRFIQMLDDESYPKAFLEFGNFRIEFSRSSLRGDEILCDARVTRKDSI